MTWKSPRHHHSDNTGDELYFCPWTVLPFRLLHSHSLCVARLHIGLSSLVLSYSLYDALLYYSQNIKSSLSTVTRIGRTVVSGLQEAAQTECTNIVHFDVVSELNIGILV